MRIKHTLLKLSLTSVLGMALLAGACSEQGTQPEISASSEADFARNGAKKKHLVQVSLTNPAPMHVETEVGPRGALLQADRYFLLIPAGAVHQKTNFTMDVGTDGLVTLEAYRERGNGTRIDVGAAGFAKKLTLALYYGQSPEAVENASKLQVAWVQENGVLTPVPTELNKDYHVVYGQLSHFSQYALATPRDDYDAF
jgi:hypothetical protein